MRSLLKRFGFVRARDVHLAEALSKEIRRERDAREDLEHYVDRVLERVMRLENKLAKLEERVNRH